MRLHHVKLRLMQICFSTFPEPYPLNRVRRGQAACVRAAPHGAATARAVAARR
jgi:hypothetical protein